MEPSYGVLESSLFPGDQPGAADRFQPVALALAPPPQPQHLHQWLVPHYDVPTDVGTPWRLVDWDGTNQGTAHVKSVLQDRKNHDQHVWAKMLHVELALINSSVAFTSLVIHKLSAEDGETESDTTTPEHEQLHFQNIEKSDLAHQILAKQQRESFSIRRGGGGRVTTRAEAAEVQS
ncbi:hypothetical protein C4D60_Mb03t07620 [Musa balbisiana]|uniref:Uncharacterized protein n=1 Tax=Musa balbisiana TaxID=52838 RepID=A0A4S8JA00_MUSBA|nr:hypothetical protein C4D60_Mb03t07620 [Musa balbisiana]